MLKKIIIGALCYVGSTYAQAEEEVLVVGNGKGYQQIKLKEDGSICLMNRKDPKKEDKCKPATADNGFKVKINNPLFERGFLLRFCLKPKVGLPAKEDFDKNYRVNIIAIPNNDVGIFPHTWSNVFEKDFTREDASESGKGYCKMTDFMPPNLSGFEKLIIEPRRIIQLNSDSAATHEAFIDIVPELHRNKYSWQQYLFGIIFTMGWAFYYPVKLCISYKIKSGVEQAEKDHIEGRKTCWETHDDAECKNCCCRLKCIQRCCKPDKDLKFEKALMKKTEKNVEKNGEANLSLAQRTKLKKKVDDKPHKPIRKWSKLFWCDEEYKNLRPARACYCSCLSFSDTICGQQCCKFGSTFHDDYDMLEKEDLVKQNLCGGCFSGHPIKKSYKFRSGKMIDYLIQKQEANKNCCTRCCFKLKNQKCCKTVTIKNKKREARIKKTNQKMGEKTEEGIPKHPEYQQIDDTQLLGLVPYFINEFWVYWTFEKQIDLYIEVIFIIALWGGIVSMVLSWISFSMWSFSLLLATIFFFVFSIYMFFMMLVGQKKIDEFSDLTFGHQATYLFLLFINCAKITKSNRFNSHKGVMIVFTPYKSTTTKETYQFRPFKEQYSMTQYTNNYTTAEGNMKRNFENKLKYRDLLAAIVEEKRKLSVKGKKDSKELSKLKKDKKHENDKFDLKLERMKIETYKHQLKTEVSHANNTGVNSVNVSQLANKVVFVDSKEDQKETHTHTQEEIKQGTTEARRLNNVLKNPDAYEITWVDYATEPATYDEKTGEELTKEVTTKIKNGPVPRITVTSILEKKAAETEVEFDDFDAEVDVDPHANPSYADSLLNLLQNAPNFIISVLNMKLMGDSYFGVIGLFIAWIVAVTSCQSIIFDGPKAWGGKRTCTRWNCYFPVRWFCSKDSEGKDLKPPTPCFFKSIILLTYIFNFLVMIVPLMLFVILTVEESSTSTDDYPEWANSNNSDYFSEAFVRQIKQMSPF